MNNKFAFLNGYVENHVGICSNDKTRWALMSITFSGLGLISSIGDIDMDTDGNGSLKIIGIDVV